MPGPDWDDDDPADLARIGASSTALLRDLAASAADRALPDLGDVCGWHRRLYQGCRVPVDGYVGRFRGDPGVPELVDYEVGVGPILADGYAERMGVWSVDLAQELASLLGGIHAGLLQLDIHLPVGTRPRTVDELAEVVQLVAVVHGEWVRLHPFANGNGRTARVWAAFVALRYGLGVFVALKPRPDDIGYVRASRDSMGRPPDFRGDHSTAVAVFGHLLSLSLLDPPR